MVFSPRLNKTIVQNATNKKGESANIIYGNVNDMLKTARILEQRKHLTLSPQVLIKDQLMLNKIYSKLGMINLTT